MGLRRVLVVGTCVVLLTVLVVVLVRAARNDAAIGQAASTTHRMTLGGLARSYRLYAPEVSGASPDAGQSLVVVLHGGFGSARQAERAYGWNALADREGFLVAYPDGWRRAWNTEGGCCGPPADRGVDDVAFLEAVVAELRAERSVDPDRVYVAGMSNGAIMAYTLGCRSTTFAAIGPVAGTALVRCPDAAPVSVIHVHGLADTRVRYDGARGEGTAQIDGPPVEQVNADWRRAHDCAPPSSQVDGPVRTLAATCAAGREVRLVTVDGAGHQWPGSATNRAAERLGADPPSRALDATGLIWEFFASHPNVR